MSKELLPGSYTFIMTNGYARQERSQDIAADPNVVFQTVKVTVQLKDRTGELMDGGAVEYRFRGWHVFTQDMQLLPGTYTFRFNDRPESRSYRIVPGTVTHIL